MKSLKRLIPFLKDAGYFKDRHEKAQARKPIDYSDINSKPAKSRSNYESTLDKPSLPKSEKLVHYSAKQGLKTLDPQYQGTGAPAEENRQPVDVKSTSFYRENTEPEQIVTQRAKSKYKVPAPDASKLYDLGKDPAGLVGKLIEASKSRQINPGAVTRDEKLKAVRDAGYHGFYNSGSALEGVVNLFHPSHVAEEEQLKSEDLEKASKNVRIQRKKVFGTQSTPPKGKMRDKHMQHISDFVARNYGMEMQPSGGKIDEKTGQRRSDSPVVGEDKPDWRSGSLESQSNPDAAVHEIAHLNQLPEGVDLPEGQRMMDRQYADVQRKYGYMKQKVSEHEVQPMAMENPIRRRAGLPATNVAVPVKPGEGPRMSVDTKRPIATRVQRGKKQVDLIRQSRNLSPENKDRQRMIDEGILQWTPNGWERSNTPDAKINERQMLREKGAQGPVANKQVSRKLAASEMTKAIKSPSKHMSLARLKQIKQDHAIGAQGQEYSEEELNNEINARSQSQGEKQALAADRSQRKTPQGGVMPEDLPFLFHRMKKKDLIPGGLAQGKTNKDFPPKRIAQGRKVEMEHTSSKRVADEIARDHLTEDAKYYDKLKTVEKSSLKKMSRPAIRFPNLKVSTRPDQNVQLIETPRQAEMFGRKSTQSLVRDHFDKHPKSVANKENVQAKTSKKITNQFGRNTLGLNVENPKTSYQAALAGKMRTKHEPADEQRQADLEAHRKKVKDFMSEYNQQRKIWGEKATEIINKPPTPERSKEIEEIMAQKPKAPRKPPAPRQKLKDTKDLSPKEMSIRGRTVDSTIQHEALHGLLDEVGRQHGEMAAMKLKHGLLSAHDPETLRAVGNFIEQTAGYKRKSPHFDEEVLTHTRDLLVNPRKRESFKHHLRDEAKYNQHMKNLKIGHQRAYEYAQSVTPEQIVPKGASKLAASEGSNE